MVSIIIPVYNSEKYLEECIISVMNQTYKNLEIILIDDGSSDRSSEICDVFAKKDTRIKVLHQKNGGVSQARNKGIELSSGEYVAFVDSDDIVNPYLIEKQLFWVEHENADLCIGEYEYFSSNIPQTRNIIVSGETYTGEKALEKIMGGTFSNLGPVTKLIRRSLLKSIRFPENISIGEDMVFSVKLFLAAKKVIYIPMPYYYYRQSITDSSTSKAFDSKIKTMNLAYDEMKKIIGCNRPKIFEGLEKRKYRMDLHAMDIMIKLGIPLNNEFFQSLYRNIIHNKLAMMGDPALSLKSKFGIILLVINPKVYRNVKLFLFKRKKR